MSLPISQLYKGPLLPPRDLRTLNWKLAGNVPFIATVILCYIYVVKFIGPRFMKGREPFKCLRPLIMIHNAAMILVNVYFLFAIGSRTHFGGGASFFCQGLDRSGSVNSFEVADLLWWYLMVRIIDFLDTVFFVLRKKDSHVSVLHVGHHVLVVFTGWFGMTYGPDGQALLMIHVNTFVHVVMYTYYFLTLLGPRFQSYLWWKRYLTQLQIAQFIFMLVHAPIPLFVDCGYPLAHVLVIMSQVAFYFFMFVRFYVQSYRKRLKSA
ncbi:hypothetical protein HPB49_006922 [Dermacentor silvarum]|uniref:Uncharacterized protein n=1 Tax=Dermacentor silvarum TaxID=543639 RepID=A0ACB8CVS4_DERSI|nr:elongation of very long chain fatty acids protein AAEL008004 [Dermacentor silvarum]KAH7953292.1 hypothetical protein HPB49_006922 [Dermacentor silvarum]